MKRHIMQALVNGEFELDMLIEDPENKSNKAPLITFMLYGRRDMLPKLKHILDENPDMRLNLNAKSFGYYEGATPLFILAYHINEENMIEPFLSRQDSNINIDLNTTAVNFNFFNQHDPGKDARENLFKEGPPSVAALLINNQFYNLLSQCLKQNGFSINLTKSMVDTLIQDNQKELLLDIIKHPNNKMQPDKIAAMVNLYECCKSPEEFSTYKEIYSLEELDKLSTAISLLRNHISLYQNHAALDHNKDSNLGKHQLEISPEIQEQDEKSKKTKTSPSASTLFLEHSVEKNKSDEPENQKS